MTFPEYLEWWNAQPWWWRAWSRLYWAVTMSLPMPLRMRVVERRLGYRLKLKP